MQQLAIDLFWRLTRRCADCGHQFDKASGPSLWGRCRRCENARLGQ